MIFTWQKGEIVKRYNGKPCGKYRSEPPQSVAAFEALLQEALLARSEVAMHEFSL